MAIVRIARVSHEQVGALADGFPNAWMKLTGGRVGKAQLKLGMALDLHGAPWRMHPALEVFPVGESAVLETRARQGGTRFDSRVEMRSRHEQVIVTGLGIDMPGLALDQVAQYVIGHPTAEAAVDLPLRFERLIEHQCHFVVKPRRRGADLQGQRITVGAVQKRRLQPLGQGAQLLDALAVTALAPSRQHNRATGVDDEQFREVVRLGQLVQQWRAVVSQSRAKVFSKFRQVFPLFSRPAVQQLHARLGNGFESLLDDRISRSVEPAGPAHAELAGFSEPRQPTLLTR
ncbi:hypothetical protein D3C73_1032560 [compost metagenome]